jgi:undecaprenyl pyrophosphate phosphatase UppP
MEKELENYRKKAKLYAILALVFVLVAFVPIIFGIVPEVDVYKHLITWVQIAFALVGMGFYLLSSINRNNWEHVMREERKRVKEDEFNEIVKEMGDDKEVQNKLIDWYNKYVK